MAFHVTRNGGVELILGHFRIDAFALVNTKRDYYPYGWFSISWDYLLILKLGKPGIIPLNYDYIWARKTDSYK